MIEIFKDIPGYEGLYQVSNLGRIKSLQRKTKYKNSFRIRKESFLVTLKDKAGYLRVNLYNKNINRKSHAVHRLVMLAFKGYSELDVNHKDTNKQNNYLDNLEYCNDSYNLIHAWKNGRMDYKKLKVKQYDLNGIFIKEYNSMREAGRQTGIAHESISLCCNNKLKSAGKYIWKKS